MHSMRWSVIDVLAYFGTMSANSKSVYLRLKNIGQMAFPAILSVMHGRHEDTCSALYPSSAITIS